MTDEELLLMIRGAIASLPAAQRRACEELAEKFRQGMTQAGSPVGELAIGLVGAEMQVKLGD